MEQRPGVKIDVQGGGSTAGIVATSNGTCNIGTSSRELKSQETGLRIHLLCLDGITVVVHASNSVTALTEQQVRDIFAGRTQNWSELGGPDARIIAVSREEGSGTRGAFEELVMSGTAVSDACLVQDSNGAVREIIASTAQGIGYISAGLVDDRVRAVAIDGVAPTMDNFRDGTYRLVRPFLLLTRDEPCGTVKEFIEYARSTEAQEILRGYGLITANTEAQ